MSISIKCEENGALKKEYRIIYFAWYEMARRTTDPEHQAKHPTYKDTWVCEEWKYFSNFLNWSLANGHCKGLDLDKDIIDIGKQMLFSRRLCFCEWCA